MFLVATAHALNHHNGLAVVVVVNPFRLELALRDYPVALPVFESFRLVFLGACGKYDNAVLKFSRRCALEFCSEVAHKPGHLVDFRVEHDADFRLGFDLLDGLVEESLPIVSLHAGLECAQVAAQFSGLLDQVHMEALPCERQRSRHSGNTAAHYQAGFSDTDFPELNRLE